MIMYDFHQYADAAQPKMTQKPLEEQMYLVPPKEEQIKFVDFVKLIDNRNFAVLSRVTDFIPPRYNLIKKTFYFQQAISPHKRSVFFRHLI